MKFISAIVSFENLYEVRRLCHWGPVIALSVIAVCSTMAILDSIIWYWPLDTTGGSVNFIMLLNWTVLILYNYFNAMFVGPGYIPLGWKPVRISVSGAGGGEGWAVDSMHDIKGPIFDPQV